MSVLRRLLSFTHAATFCCCKSYLLSFVDPTKFFGCELGAQTQFDTKNDRYIVNGSHEANKLQDMLDGFIKKFVLCAECDNPETDLVRLGQHLEHRGMKCGSLYIHGGSFFPVFPACQPQETNHWYFL